MNGLKDFLVISSIFTVTVALLTYIWITSFHYKNTEEESAKLFYPEGKAILSTGRVCIINTAALESEYLALKLTKACINEYKKQSANPQ